VSQNTKISNLTELTDPSSTDFIPIVDTVNKETKKISYNSLTSGFYSESSDILPDSDITYDIGSPDKRFRDLYLSENSIFLGDSTISFSGGPSGGLFVSGSGGNDRLINDKETGQFLSNGGSGNFTEAFIQSSLDIGRYIFLGDELNESKIQMKGMGPVKYEFTAGANGFKFTDEDYDIDLINIPHPFINSDGSRNVITLDSTRVQGNFLATGGMYHSDSITGPQYGFGGGSDLHLKTSGVSRLAVTKESGNVGIGTTSPDARLHVDGHFKLNISSANRTPGKSVALIKSDNGTAANLRVEGPIAATHDLFKNSGADNGFADNSNHFHTVQKINRITQQVGAGKPNERVQEQYYAIANNNLKNNKAAFWNWHRVSRSVASASVSLTNLVGWNVSAIQDTDNRSSNSEASFPAGGAEAAVLTFDSESNRSAVLSNGDLLQVTISIDFEGAIVAATLYAEVTAVDAEQATVVLYGGNYKSIGQVPDGNDQIALTSGFTINKIDVNQYMGLSDGTVTVLTDNTRATETDTFSLSFSSAHSLELNDVITVITDGDSSHGFKDAEVAFVKEVTSTTEAKFVYGRVFDPAPASARNNVTGSSFVGILRGTLDGLHRFTAGDQLMHFNADNQGRYKSYQIGPGSEVGADCIAIGKNVYNKDASTIKIGYDNNMLNIDSAGIDVAGTINATGTITADGDVKLSDFTSTSRSTDVSALDPIQNNQPASDDTVANLSVDSSGNVVRGSQEATWTFSRDQLNALTTAKVNLLSSPGAGKCIVVEESNWLIEVDLTKAAQSTPVSLTCEIVNGQTQYKVATQITAANLTLIAGHIKTANTDAFGMYSRDVPELDRISKFNEPMTIRAKNSSGVVNFPDNFVSVKLKVKYRVFDKDTF